MFRARFNKSNRHKSKQPPAVQRDQCSTPVIFSFCQLQALLQLHTASVACKSDSSISVDPPLSSLSVNPFAFLSCFYVDSPTPSDLLSKIRLCFSPFLSFSSIAVLGRASAAHLATSFSAQRFGPAAYPMQRRKLPLPALYGIRLYTCAYLLSFDLVVSSGTSHSKHEARTRRPEVL